MYLCICEPLTDKEVKQYVDEHKNQSSHHILKKLVHDTHCGKQCGKCIKSIKDVIHTEKALN